MGNFCIKDTTLQNGSFDVKEIIADVITPLKRNNSTKMILCSNCACMVLPTRNGMNGFAVPYVNDLYEHLPFCSGECKFSFVNYVSNFRKSSTDNYVDDTNFSFSDDDNWEIDSIDFHTGLHTLCLSQSHKDNMVPFHIPLHPEIEWNINSIDIRIPSEKSNPIRIV